MSILIYAPIAALYAQGLWRVVKLLFGPLVRNYPPRAEGCPGRPEGWA